MKIIKCDVCGKEFNLGMKISIETQGGYSFEDIADLRKYIGEKDICLNCLKKIFERCENEHKKVESLGD